MVKLYDSGVYLLNGKTLVREKDAELSLNKEEAKKGTIAYGILQAHNHPDCTSFWSGQISAALCVDLLPQ